MRFNSINNANVSNYVDAGRSSGRSSQGILDSIKKASPNYAQLGKTFQDIDSSKAQQSMKADANILKNVIKGNQYKEEQKLIADFGLARTKADVGQRMAGYLGALGGDFAKSAAKAFMPEPEKPAPVQYDLSNIEARIKAQSEQLKAMQAVYGGPDGPVKAYIKDGVVINPLQNQQVEGAPQVSTPSGQLPTGTPTAPAPVPAPAPAAPAQSVSFQPQAATGFMQVGALQPLTPANRKALDLLRSVESAAHGHYDAYNLGGSAGGHVAHGSGNSAVNSPFGAPVSALSLDQIHEIHDSGRGHAMGGYQFTGAGGLREAQAALNLPGSTIYSPDVQDQLGLAYGRQRIDSLGSAWIGFNNLNDIEKETVRRGLLDGLI